jgi:hypothetical protein
MNPNNPKYQGKKWLTTRWQHQQQVSTIHVHFFICDLFMYTEKKMFKQKVLC